MGRSLGSASVLHITKHEAQHLNGLIVESGFCSEQSLFELFQINPASINYQKPADGFDNQTKISNYYGPLLVIHATDDHILPFSEGELLHNTCPSNHKEFLKIEGANHNNILSVSPDQYFEAVSKFIRSHISSN